MKTFDFGIEPESVCEFNSNNAWGFGGAHGLLYTFKHEIKVKIALASTRHSGTFPFISVTQRGRRLFDEVNSPKNRVRAADLVKRLVEEVA